MQTTLTYRFPKGELFQKVGVFRVLENPAAFEGFLVSNFEGTTCYGFFENEKGEIAAEHTAPIVISQAAYLDLAYEFIHYLQDHAVGKAILSRVKQVASSQENRLELFKKLAEAYPNTFCYTFESPLLGTWIGATPETLLEIESGRGKTMSLAGTKPQSDTTPWGDKELEEQQLVTDFIHAQLQLQTKALEVSERMELTAGPVKHLVHHFQFDVAAEKQWELAKQLHPTPAVSGFPRDKALQCIANFEPHERELYAGLIGVKSPEKTHLFVNLRSGRWMHDDLFLFVGGGLTQQSSPQDEWMETENKASTITKWM